MIMAALLDHLATLVFAPALPIAMPNMAFTPPTSGASSKAPLPYLRAFFLPNQTRQVTVGDDPQQKRGMLQVSILWPSGQGLVKPLDVAGAIVNHFKNQVLTTSSGTVITIYNEPWAASPLQEDDRVQIPVTIPYSAFEQET
jgi:hypothetical protein